MKQNPGRELLEFCRDHRPDVPRLTAGTTIWPTNSLSERGVRPLTTQQKISGRLTSDNVTQDRLDIRSYIDTAVHGLGALDVSHQLMPGTPGSRQHSWHHRKATRNRVTSYTLGRSLREKGDCLWPREHRRFSGVLHIPVPSAVGCVAFLAVPGVAGQLPVADLSPRQRRPERRGDRPRLVLIQGTVPLPPAGVIDDQVPPSEVASKLECSLPLDRPARELVI